MAQPTGSQSGAGRAQGAAGALPESSDTNDKGLWTLLAASGDMYSSLRCQVQCTPSDTVSPLLAPFPHFNVAPTASPRAPLTLQEITGRTVGGTVGAPLGGAEGICGEALGVPVGGWAGLLDG